MVRPLSISFEFFPPKTDEGKAQLWQTAERLTQLHPHFFSVTFGAGGSTRAGTLETVVTLQQQTAVPIAPHIACMGMMRAELITIIQHYQSCGVKRVIALRGDMPSGMVTTGELQYASELVSLIRKTAGDHIHIEVAAYPEVHPQASHAHADIMNLKRKFDAGANSAITQYFFNADAYFYFMDQCRTAGIHQPIIPGIMPITQFVRLARFSDICGAEIPRWIRKRLESYADDLESIKAFGLEVIQHLCEQLMHAGVPGLHFYTLNQADASLALLSGFVSPSAVAVSA